jgi:hypothetical protein
VHVDEEPTADDDRQYIDRPRRVPSRACHPAHAAQPDKRHGGGPGDKAGSCGAPSASHGQHWTRVLDWAHLRKHRQAIDGLLVVLLGPEWLLVDQILAGHSAREYA